MKSCMPVGSISSGSSSFMNGASCLEKASLTRPRPNWDHSRASFPTCALVTEVRTGQDPTGLRELKQQISMLAAAAATTTSTTNAKLQEVVVERKRQVQAVAPAIAAAAVPKNSEAILRRSPNAVKPLTRAMRFEAALQRAWSSRSHPAAAMTNAAEGFLTLLEPETHPPYADSAIQLVDNFAPVAEECPPTSGLEVTGSIPDCLNGIYIRNGSNPQFMPSGRYHYFDGDGMLHAVRIKDGVPSYCCRFTQTSRYLKEKAMGQTLYPCVMGELSGWIGMARLGLFNLRGSLGVVDQTKGIGTANAGLAFYNGRLLAMSEDDMPYAIAVSQEDGDLQTLGRYDLTGSNKLSSMTAHPKIDPVTGEMFSYSYSVVEKPYVRFWRASPEGKMHRPVPIDVQDPVLLHDFAVTENYVVIPDPTMVFRLQEMLAGRSPIGMDEAKGTRFGILPKYATDASAMRWFKAPGVSCFHYLNAWEEGDEIVLVGSNNTPPSNVFNNPAALRCYLTEYRMNLKTGSSSQRRVSEWNLDVGRINERFAGRKTRYVYLTMSGPWPKFSGIVKLDLHAGAGAAEVGVRKFPAGCYGSEPVFVPRTNGRVDADTEDDGYVVTFLHNENTNVSEMGIFDARSPTLEPVATVKLPARVPYGFHGIFLSEEQLANQNSLPFSH